MATLYLLPNRIADRPVEETIPTKTLDVLRSTRYFLAENAKSARAYLKAAGHPLPIAELHIEEIGHRPDVQKIDAWLSPLSEGHDVAIVSESGCPGIADPGADIVAVAQARGLTVKPLTGPSSIFLALMASGLDGQHFRFLGYLPIKEPERSEALLAAERQSARGETQIFIETPYRNTTFLEFLTQTLRNDTRITVAQDLTGDAEFVRTRSAQDWRKDLPTLAKMPTIFCILAQSRKATTKDTKPSLKHFKGKKKAVSGDKPNRNELKKTRPSCRDCIHPKSTTDL